ncbi:MAG: RNA polymerase sigma factor, partial [Gemmatimonadota bacterium]
AARNAAHNRREREALRRGEPLDETVAAATGSPLENAELAQLRARLLEALERLRERERSVVLLHDLEGWLHREIGETMGISEAMSRRLLSDARGKMRIMLGSDRERTEDRRDR